jgi:D-3-phosphoglycerate dehydrogenase
VPELDGAICGDDRFTRRVLTQAPRLRVISKLGTGIDSIDRQACSELGIRLCNTPDAFSIPVADQVLAWILAFARNVCSIDQAMKSGQWHKLPCTSLSECTLGIVGVGNVGKAVARRAAAFGVTLLGTDPISPPAAFLNEVGMRMVTLNELLAASDFVSLNCDLNPTSHHLISTEQLGRMKPTARIINTARGPIIDEPALVSALRQNTIAGAAMDVFEVEPLPLESPLRRMSNVLLAPHNANSSPRAWEKVHRNTINNLLKGLAEVQR